jgi:DNA replication and repair protein RecF
LAALVADCEQVLITAAVGADVPDVLRRSGTTYAVELGQVHAAVPTTAAAESETSAEDPVFNEAVAEVKVPEGDGDE